MASSSSSSSSSSPPLPHPLIPSTFQDTSTECAICLEPLVVDDDDLQHQAGDHRCDDISEQHHHRRRRVLTLTCGHRWHYDCIAQQLRVAQPTPAQRLLFTGCRCAKCGSTCEHPDLENLTRTTDRLRAKVDAMLEEQIQADAPDVWRQAVVVAGSNDPSSSRRSILDDARRKYAFYMCSHCKEPFFGGTMECADLMVGDNVDGDEGGQQQERLCVACAPQSQVACQNPLEHGRYLIWKCRYCCQPSTHLCYGNVHFCDGCHERNSDRVRELQQTRQQRLHHHIGGVHPPPLEPIPCPGGSSCPFPKRAADGPTPHQHRHHSNGPTVDCEQVYSCAFCESDVAGRSIHHFAQAAAPGSHNLLQNPSGQEGMQGWMQLNPTLPWKVEPSVLPVNADITTNFVSSYQTCVMCQVVDFDQVLLTTRPPTTTTADDARRHDGAAAVVPPPQPVKIEISAKYMARSDCPSVFRLEAALFDARPPRLQLGIRQQQQRIRSQPFAAPLQYVATPTLEAPPDYWERACLELEVPSPGALRGTHLRVYVVGKDSKFWRGYFGSKVADVSVRILGSPDRIRELLGGPDVAVAAGPAGHAPQQPREARQNRAPSSSTGNEGNDLQAAAAAGGGGGGGRIETSGNTHADTTNRRSAFWIVLDVVVPVVCFLLLALMARD